MYFISGLRSVIKSFPNMKILTSEVHPVAPNHFGQKYFGTDWSQAQKWMWIYGSWLVFYYEMSGTMNCKSGFNSRDFFLMTGLICEDVVCSELLYFQRLVAILLCVYYGLNVFAWCFISLFYIVVYYTFNCQFLSIILFIFNFLCNSELLQYVLLIITFYEKR